MHGATIVASSVDRNALIGFSGGAMKTLMAFQEIIGRENVSAIINRASNELKSMTSPYPDLPDNLPSLPVAQASLDNAHHGVSGASPKSTGTQIA